MQRVGKGLRWLEWKGSGSWMGGSGCTCSALLALCGKACLVCVRGLKSEIGHP